MARTAATIQLIKVSASVVPTFVAAPGAGTGNGITLNATSGVIVEVKNTGAGACTVTLHSNTVKIDNWFVPADTTYNCPATTGDIMFAVNDPPILQQADGLVYIDFSTITGVTYTVYQVPQVAT